jgi:hypothetical protein
VQGILDQHRGGVAELEKISIWLISDYLIDLIISVYKPIYIIHSNKERVI